MNASTKTDFYLTSSESRLLSEVRACRVIATIKGEFRQDNIVVQVVPSLIGQAFGLGATDIDRLVLTTRHEGASLLPPNETPVYVYVARALTDEVFDRGSFGREEIEVIGWGEVYADVASIPHGYPHRDNEA